MLASEARAQAVQLADAGRAEAFGIRGAQQQLVGHLPAQAVLGNELAAEGRVVRVAPGDVQVQLLSEARIGQQPGR
jgi:hypothetical protein